jgi:hypothetical protein
MLSWHFFLMMQSHFLRESCCLERAFHVNDHAIETVPAVGNKTIMSGEASAFWFQQKQCLLSVEEAGTN